MVRWAPLKLPIHRRLQTATIMAWIFLMPLLVSSYFLLFLSRVTFPLALAYAIFIYFDSSPETGGRQSIWFRKMYFWRLMKDYFPMTLIKTVDLDPSKNYVFGYHPHGIIALGAFTNFGTEASNFSKLFPNIHLRVLTLATNFIAPVWRELLLTLGFCSVSRRSCDTILSHGPGHSCMIVVGGATEALYAHPGTSNLVVKKRLGFIKLALRHGASLVPVYAFGENDIWDQVPNPEGSFVRAIQRLFQKYMTFSPPLFHGRGIFQYDVGILPHRKSLVTVVGEPIECPKMIYPTNDVILEYQRKYIEGLQNIYDTYKDKYAKNRKTELKIIE